MGKLASKQEEKTIGEISDSVMQFRDVLNTWEKRYLFIN